VLGSGYSTEHELTYHGDGRRWWDGGKPCGEGRNGERSGWGFGIDRRRAPSHGEGTKEVEMV
jgi:hypothetical protein